MEPDCLSARRRPGAPERSPPRRSPAESEAHLKSSTRRKLTATALAALALAAVLGGSGASSADVAPGDCVGVDDSDGGVCTAAAAAAAAEGRGRGGKVSRDAPKEDGVAAAEDRCGLYLAESSIPGAGLGLYSAAARAAGSPVTHVSDVCFALADLEDESVINDYEWDAGTMGTESEAAHAASLCPGLGMILNGHLHLHNVDPTFPSVDGAGLHRSRDPGAGAITRYHNLSGTAKVDVPAGSELFLHYGESYFADRTDILGNLPFEEDFAQNDRIARNLVGFFDRRGVNLTEGQRTGAIDVVKAVLGEVESMNKVMGILPRTVEEARRMAKMGTARSMLPDSIRSPEWLEENGICADNLRAGPSTNPAAGRGAFAVRYIPKGEVIAPAPVLYFRDEAIFDLVYSDGSLGKQIIVNYCYGHPESSVLLLPYSPVVNYINHDSASPNAALRWSASRHHRTDPLEARLEDLEAESGSGPLMEFVALRDVRPGEEIFLDYGPEWRRAWEGHVRAWAPPENSGSYVAASELNDITARPDLAVLRTVEEQVGRPYPDNISIGCFVTYYRNDADYTDVGREDEERVTIDMEWEEVDYMWKGHHYLRPCEILERHEAPVDGVDDAAGAEEDGGDGKTAAKALTEEEEVGEEGGSDGSGDKRPEEERYVYTVQVYNLPGTDDAEKVYDFEELIVTGVPRYAIKFMDNLYTSDQHLEGTFRHPIGLPDGMLPEGWRNRRGGHR